MSYMEENSAEYLGSVFENLDLDMYIEKMGNLYKECRPVKAIYADFTIRLYHKLMGAFVSYGEITGDETEETFWSIFGEFLRKHCIHAFINPDELLSYKELIEEDKYKELKLIMNESIA